MVNSLRLDYEKAWLDRIIWMIIIGVLLINILNLTDEINLHPSRESSSVLYFWVYRHGLGAFSIMAVMLSGCGYASSFFREKEAGSWKYYLIRQRILSYGVSKIIVTLSTAVLSVFAAYLILLLFLSSKYPLFPDTADEIIQIVNDRSFLEVALNRNMLFFFLNIIPEVLMFGFLSVFSLCVALFARSKYAVIASPLLIYYGWNYISGTFSMPDVLCWPLKMDRGFQYLDNSVWNTLFTGAYYLAGIVLLSLLFILQIRKAAEYA